MNPPEGDFDDEFNDFDDDNAWNYVPGKIPSRQNPSRDQPPSGQPWKRSRQDNTTSQNQAPESQQPWKRARKIDDDRQSGGLAPWKRSRGKPFVGDVATVELRNKTRKRLSDPPAPPVGAKHRMALRLAAIPVITAIGIVGFKFGSGPRDPLPQPASRSIQFDQSGSVSDKSAHLSSSQPKLSSRTDSGPADAAQPQRSAAKLTAPVEASISPHVLATSTRTEPRRGTSPVLGNMNGGVALMTFGDVTKARVMFQRVAEAGGGEGAFALAETYDPLVLERLRFREGIEPDLALARTWYEKARDLGLLEARDRISRLALIPQ